jgi:hypothetical protein
MILADSSVWVEHFRSRLPGFTSWLAADETVMHTVLLGEMPLLP